MSVVRRSPSRSPNRFGLDLVLLLSYLLVSLIFPRLALALPGDPDPGFSLDGRVRLGFGGGTDLANAVAQQSDGKFIVAGVGQNGGWGIAELLVARYNADGTLDPTFGDGGVAWHFASPDTGFFANAVAVQSDGKIVIGGYSDRNYTTEWFVARLNSNGTLDPTFHFEGLTYYGNRPGLIQAVAVLADGRILLSGSHGTSNRQFAVGRITSDGSWDETFGTDGVVKTSILTSSIAYSMVVLGAKYLAVGGATQNSPSSSAIALVQYHDNGVLDSSFSGDGIATTYVGSQAQGRAVTLQFGLMSPTKIVVAGEANNGSSYSRFVILRYLLDGSLDTSFDSDGYVVPLLSNYDSSARAVRVVNVAGNPSRIYAGGFSHTAFGNESAEFAAVKVNMAGTLDATFDGDGIARTSFGSDGARGSAMYLTNRLTLVGIAGGYFQQADVAIARFVLADGSLDTAFDGDGKRLDDFGHPWSQAADVAVQSDGRIVLAGSVNDGQFAVARFLPDGMPDVSFAGKGHLAWSVGTYDSRAKAVLVQSDNRIVVGGQGDFPRCFALTRLMGDGSTDPGFGMNGVSFTPSVNGIVTDLLQQPDGKLIAAGIRYQNFDVNVALARYGTSGNIDPTFGGNGTGAWTWLPQRQTDPVPPAVAFQPDGRIVVACEFGGEPPDGIAICRLTANGIIDSSFGTNGYVLSDLGPDLDTPRAIAIRPDGRIVIAGTREANGVARALVVRYRSNGTLDTSFGNQGQVLIDLLANFQPGGAMALRLQPDGRIVVAGFGTPDGNSDFAAVRLEPHGLLDNSYGIGGKRLVNFSSGSEDKAVALALDAAGNAILAGHSNLNFAVARILAGTSQTGVPDPVTGASGLRVSAPHPNPTALGTAIDVVLDLASRTSATIFDVHGRNVRTLFDDRLLAAGRHTLLWDGQGERGRPVPPGVYFLRVVTPEGDHVRRVAVVR